MTDHKPMLSNDQPFNLLCQDLLKQVGGDPDPSYLYSLQLAEWMLENRPDLIPDPAAKHIAELLQQVHLLYGAENPNLAQKLLLKLEPGENIPAEARAEAERLQGKSPEEVGAKLVDVLYTNLSQLLPLLQS